MCAKSARRTWIKVMTVLCLLLPGFPLLLIAGTEGMRLLGSLGLPQFGFAAVLILHALYYLLPTAIFGEPLFPAEKFGPIPTPAGYAVAAIFYGALAFVISFPICWLIRRRTIHTDKSMERADRLT